jgi:hypothetical protein
LILGLPLAGCAVAAGLPSSSNLAVNQCDANDDCGNDGQCIDGSCHATDGKLTSLLVMVTPAQSSGSYYLDYPAMGSLASNGGTVENMSLPNLVQVTGSLLVDNSKGACTPTFIPGEGQTVPPNEMDGAIPADISFRRSRRVPGLPVDTYRGIIDANGYTFGANIPPDEYDIYIRPLKQPTDDGSQPPYKPGDTPCAVPPRLLLKQSVTGSLDFKLVAPSKLDLHVVWAKGGSPAGWTVDLIEPSTGYAMSVPRVLTPYDFISETTLDATYEVKLDYVPTYGPDDKGSLQPLDVGTSVVRLTPPVDPTPDDPSDDVPAPVLLAQLTGAELGSDPNETSVAELRQVAPLPEKVTVQFEVELASDQSPAGASVTLTATDLPGFPDLFTSFTRTVVVDEFGRGEVNLLPGTYRVVATPEETCDPISCLGTTQATWAIPASPSKQKGKILQLFPAVGVSGHAVVANGAPAVGATVRALASPSILDLNVMNRGDAKAEVLPRAAFGQVDAQGDFYFGADSGTYDFRVEPNPDTGFPWLVQPKVPIGASASDPRDLDHLHVPLPIVYRGRITSGTGESEALVPSALIRAFVYLSPDGKVTQHPSDASVAVQVAETHSDSAGDYALLIPANIILPP